MDFGMLNDVLVAATGEISGFMYTYILVFLLVIVGVWFSVRTKFVQIRYIKDMFTQLTEKKHVKGERSISSFQALMVSTASRVGTGNIAGIATAIATGGRARCFWMWLMAIIGAASAFVESTLAQIWKVRGADGEFRGGPAYYIQQALGKRWLGIVFAVALILCFAFGFNGLQSYNMASALEYYIPDYATNGTRHRARNRARGHDGVRHLRRRKAHQHHHLGHRSRHGPRLHRAGCLDYGDEPRRDSGRVLAHLRLGFRFPVDLRRIRGLGCHARHQARPVLQQAGMGSAPNAAATASVSPPGEAGVWCRAFRSTSTRCSSARARR